METISNKAENNTSKGNTGWDGVGAMAGKFEQRRTPEYKRNDIVTKEGETGGVPSIDTYVGDRLVESWLYQYEDERDKAFQGEYAQAAGVLYNNEDLYNLAIDTWNYLYDHSDLDNNTLYGELTQEEAKDIANKIKEIAKQDEYFDEETSFEALGNILSYDHDMAIHSFLEPVREVLESEKITKNIAPEA